jgi:hypothetical protein
MPRHDLCKSFSDPEACDAAAAKQMEIIKWTIARESSVLSKIRAIVIQSSVWKKFFLDDPFFTDPSDTMTGASRWHCGGLSPRCLTILRNESAQGALKHYRVVCERSQVEYRGVEV